MQDAVVNLIRVSLRDHQRIGQPMPRNGNQLGRTVPGTTYPCAPGGPNDYVYIFAQPQMWKAFVGAMGQPELADDPRFETAGRAVGKSRGAERDRRGLDPPAQQARGDAAAGRRRRAVRRLPGHRRGAGRSASAAREMIVDVDYPTRGTYQTVGCPIKLSNSPPKSASAAARRAYRRGVGALCGVAAEEVTRLREQGWCKGPAMKQRSVGRSGLRVSQVGLGCNNLGQRIDFAASQAVVHKALDAGITLFDTADTYRVPTAGSEEYLGQILGARRKDIVLATKFGNPMDKEGVKRGASRRYIMSAVEDSLRRLGTDWIDLLQVHRPDPLTPIEETLRALDDLIRQGKVRYIGCSNFAGVAGGGGAVDLAPMRPGAGRVVPGRYSLLMRRPEQAQIPMMQAYGVGLLPYYPLASGLLTGKYRRNAPLPADARLVVHVGRYKDRFINDSNWPIVEALEDFATQRGHSLLELAFGWLAAQPVVSSIIAGATKPEQVAANVKAVDWELSAEDLRAINLARAAGESLPPGA